MKIEEFNNWIAQITREASQTLQHTTLHGITPQRYAEIPEQVDFMVHWEPDGSQVLGRKISLNVGSLRTNGAAVVVSAVSRLLE